MYTTSHYDLIESLYWYAVVTAPIAQACADHRLCLCMGLWVRCMVQYRGSYSITHISRFNLVSERRNNNK